MKTIVPDNAKSIFKDCFTLAFNNEFIEKKFSDGIIKNKVSMTIFIIINSLIFIGGMIISTNFPEEKKYINFSVIYGYIAGIFLIVTAILYVLQIFNEKGVFSILFLSEKTRTDTLFY